MTEPRPSRAPGGGFLIAAGAILGTLVGVLVGQPTIGFLAGLGGGAALALLLWLASRGR